MPLPRGKSSSNDERSPSSFGFLLDVVLGVVAFSHSVVLFLFAFLVMYR